MDHIVIFYFLPNILYSAVVLIWFLESEGMPMPWWASILIAVIPSVVTAFITLYTSRRSQLNRNTDSIERLQEASKRTGDKIVEDIGKTPNDKTLTFQHKELQALLEKEIEVAERRYNEADMRIRSFTIEQHHMMKDVEKFRLFLDSWERLCAENNQLHQDNLLLQRRCDRLRALLRNQTQSHGGAAANHDSAQDQDFE